MPAEDGAEDQDRIATRNDGYGAQTLTAQTANPKNWVAQLDDAVAEVFEVMLGQPCTVLGKASAMDRNTSTIAAEIVLSGTLEGRCEVRLSVLAAERLTNALLGTEGNWDDPMDDSMIDDAVGELCNMIAGGWKSRLETPASACDLSVSAVRRGYAREDLPDGINTVRRFYALGGLGKLDSPVLEVTLALTEATPGS
jgi:chemotaxis protein CheX